MKFLIIYCIIGLCLTELSLIAAKKEKLQVKSVWIFIISTFFNSFLWPLNFMYFAYLLILYKKKGFTIKQVVDCIYDMVVITAYEDEES